MPHHFQHVVLILVDERLQEELLQILCQRQIDYDIDRVLARRLRDFRNRAIGRRRPVQQEDPL